MEQRNKNPSAVGKIKPRIPKSPKETLKNCFQNYHQRLWKKDRYEKKYIHVTNLTTVFTL